MSFRVVAIIAIGIVIVGATTYWLGDRIEVPTVATPRPVKGQPLKHEANGDTHRFQGTGGMVAKFHGVSFIPYCVYQDSPGVYSQIEERGVQRCDWKRLDYQYAHDLSGQANSITLEWVPRPE